MGQSKLGRKGVQEQLHNQLREGSLEGGGRGEKVESATLQCRSN